MRNIRYGITGSTVVAGLSIKRYRVTRLQGAQRGAGDGEVSA